MKKKPLAIAILMAATLIAGGYWWLTRQPRQLTANELTLHGNVDIRQVSLAFEGNGRLAAVHAQEGDRVKAGTVLAELDTRTLTLQVAQAQAVVNVQEQVLHRLKNGARPQEVAQARSRVQAAAADAAQAAQDWQRLQGIDSQTKGLAVSAQELDRASSRLKIAQAKVDELQDALKLIELGPRTEDVSAAQAQLQVSQAQAALLEHQLAQGRLTAPTDATVRTRLMEPGDMVSPQRPVFALALMQPKWIRVYISEPQLDHVRPGLPAQIETDGRPGQMLTGKVGYVSSVAEFTPKSVQTEELRTSLVYEVRVLVDDPNDLLRMGQPATVRLVTDRAP